MKTRTDKTYFNKRVQGVIVDLKEVKKLAEDDANVILYSTKQYSKVNSAINLVEASWDILLPYERKGAKRRKIEKWSTKFKRVKDIFNARYRVSNTELVAFLEEFITFLEKETDNNE